MLSNPAKSRCTTHRRRPASSLGRGLIIAVWMAGVGVAAPPPARVISASGQFVVYADDLHAASAISTYAEHLKRQWLRALELTDTWRDPVVVVVQSNAAPPRLSVQALGPGFHLRYQLDGGLGQLPEPAWRAVFVEILCAEFANRDLPVPGALAPIPWWLTHGLAAEFGQDAEDRLGDVRRELPVAPPPSAGALLRRAAEPAADRQLQAQAWLFTTGLLSLPAGPAKLRQLLTELGAQKNVTNAFAAVYRQDFADERRLEKWWALTLAEWRTSQVARNLTAVETEKALDEILRLPVASAQKLRLELLALQAHPLYVDAIRVYRQAVEFADPKLREQADLYREFARQQVQAIGAYLDQFDQ